MYDISRVPPHPYLALNGFHGCPRVPRVLKTALKPRGERRKTTVFDQKPRKHKNSSEAGGRPGPKNLRVAKRVVDPGQKTNRVAKRVVDPEKTS